MSFRKVHKKLTKEQKERGVIFSSELKVLNNPEFNDDYKEVLATDKDGVRKIELLKNTSFFEGMAEEFGLNVINIIRR